MRQGHGIWSRLVVRLYQLLTRQLGYVDRADFSLEEQIVRLARNYFEEVCTVDSGEYWHLVVARGAMARLICQDP